MDLVTFWFIVITLLWSGFFVLEGFDFGVGMLHEFVARDEPDRRTAINTIGPLWDANEVWLIVAGAAMFAAFPGWYATMFSGLYLALALLLAAVILRGVSFEYRGKHSSARWQRGWDGLLTGASFLAPFLIGVALGDLLYGLPIDAQQEFTGSFWDLLQPYALVTGFAVMMMCMLHGATFLALKTTGDVRGRAGRLARFIGPVTVVAVIAFVVLTHVGTEKGRALNPVELLTVVAVVAATVFVYLRRERLAFAATTVTIASSIITIFVDLYPNVMVSSTNAMYNLTVYNTASPPYSLKVLTVVGVVMLPLVLAYQAWTYYVFRRRVSRNEFLSEAASENR
ncbi:cytochrome d ubiquinol oxidase subunit II [Nonomuraea sp. NPDC050536]|uniref:cytochrome d ubiquinol oxidase subunit II n=1 Tax=Nonomuraea sp. NPDC050536 TaxID=3364366 RepID=UPI0037C61225